MSKNHSQRFVDLVNDALERVPEITTDEVADRLKNSGEMVLIDTREAHEFKEGHLPGAIHLSKGVIERDIEEKIGEYDRELILYCGGGYRSALAGDNLLKMGFTNVKSMAGGWREWTEKNLSTDES
jgi:rhodanese-related sulfurtransferase